jgi:PilZ domain-containing protein
MTGPNDRPTTNRRTTARKALRCPVHLELLPRGAARDTTMWDIGVQGLSVITDHPIAPGTRCTATFELPLASGARSLGATAKAVYCSYTGPGRFKVGLMFSALDAASETAIDEFVRA